MCHSSSQLSGTCKASDIAVGTLGGNGVLDVEDGVWGRLIVGVAFIPTTEGVGWIDTDDAVEGPARFCTEFAGRRPHAIFIGAAVLEELDAAPAIGGVPVPLLLRATRPPGLLLGRGRTTVDNNGLGIRESMRRRSCTLLLGS